MSYSECSEWSLEHFITNSRLHLIGKFKDEMRAMHGSMRPAVVYAGT